MVAARVLIVSALAALVSAAPTKRDTSSDSISISTTLGTSLNGFQADLVASFNAANQSDVVSITTAVDPHFTDIENALQDAINSAKALATQTDVDLTDAAKAAAAPIDSLVNAIKPVLVLAQSSIDFEDGLASYFGTVDSRISTYLVQTAGALPGLLADVGSDLKADEALLRDLGVATVNLLGL